MPTERLQLTGQIKNRDGSLSKDTKVVNAYIETSKDGKKRLIKRPGIVPLVTLPAVDGNTTGQGCYMFLDNLMAVVENKLYQITSSGYYKYIGDINGNVLTCYFTQAGNILTPQLIYTTTPYPTENYDTISITNTNLLTMYTNIYPVETVDISGISISSGFLTSVYEYYENWPPETLSVTGLSLTDGSLRAILQIYNNWPPETVNVTGLSLTSGYLKQTLITYSNYPPETISVGGLTLTSGTLG